MKIKGIIITDGLGNAAVDKIKKLINRFEKEGWLDEMDSPGFKRLAEMYDISDRLYKEVLEAKELTWETPAGSRNAIPELREWRQLQPMILAQEKEMAMTLASRSRMKRLDPEEEETELDKAMKSLADKARRS